MSKRAADNVTSVGEAHGSKKKQKHESRKMEEKEKDNEDPLTYLCGFGNYHSTEALKGALPRNQNNPKRCPYGLIAEQLSGSAFTTPRHKNQFSWLYRITPTCVHKPLTPVTGGGNTLLKANFDNEIVEPNQTRWTPFPLPRQGSRVDFIAGLASVAGSGRPDAKRGLAIHVYCINASMGDKCMVNSDGDFLVVVQRGDLLIRTEFGRLLVTKGEIFIIPRGVKFSVDLVEEGVAARGYVCEVYDGHFALPELGPLGANALANPSHFQYPTAWYEDRRTKFTLVQKFLGKLFFTTLDHSPYDVVAWKGTYAPFKYNLFKYMAVNSVTYDHPDPSIFTVLTVQTTEPGVAACDFVIFPPRWLVQEHTFKPPYYHRNCMSEFMGNIGGQYDAKPTGFLPGSASLHSCMMGHGPDKDSFERNSVGEDKPVRLSDGDMAFMFESTYILRLTEFGHNKAIKDNEYWKVWQGLGAQFDPTKP